jgi:hypothetical protein
MFPKYHFLHVSLEKFFSYPYDIGCLVCPSCHFIQSVEGCMHVTMYTISLKIEITYNIKSSNMQKNIFFELFLRLQINDLNFKIKRSHNNYECETK